MDVSIEMNMEQTARVSPTLIAVNQILALFHPRSYRQLLNRKPKKTRLSK